MSVFQRLPTLFALVNHDNGKNMMTLPVEKLSTIFYTLFKVRLSLYITYNHQNVEKLDVLVRDIYVGQN